MWVSTQWNRADKVAGGLTRCASPVFLANAGYIRPINHIYLLLLLIYGKLGFAGCDIVGCGAGL